MNVEDMKQGTKVYYTPKTEAAQNLSSLLGGGFNMAAGIGSMSPVHTPIPQSMKDALDEGRCVRKQATIDRVIVETEKDEQTGVETTTTTVRLILCDTFEHAWATPDEIQPLDMVTMIGDLENTKTLEEQLADMKAEEEKEKQKERRRERDRARRQRKKTS